MAKTVATEFDKIINEGRERKKNEALAAKIFSRSRRQSAPSKTNIPAGPSLASRVGVKKRTSVAGAKAAPAKGDVNGEWTHDLHASVNPSNKRQNPNKPTLLSRITSAFPTIPTGPANKKNANARRAKLTSALDRMDVDSSAPANINVRPSSAAGKGLSIRGLAGPFAVMAQNFAPGTTAADVESAMTPIGGEMEACRIVKTNPIIIVEMVFASREGGERVIQTFNDKTADGRTLKVYPKIGTNSAVRNTRRDGHNANDQVVDGSMGFPEPSVSERVANNTNQRRGRGGRGRGGR